MKIMFIVSSWAMYQYLNNIDIFIKEEVKVKIFDGELQIDGFKGLFVEAIHHMSEIRVPAVKMKQLRAFLKHITDQPLTIIFEEGSQWIEVKNVFI